MKEKFNENFIKIANPLAVATSNIIQPLSEQKLTWQIIYKLQQQYYDHPNLKENEIYIIKFSLQNFQKKFSLENDPNWYKRIYKFNDQLTQLRYIYKDDEKKISIFRNLFLNAFYDDGQCEYHLNPIFKYFLINVKNQHVQTYIKHLKLFSSKYTNPFYSLMLGTTKGTNFYTKTFSIEQLHILFCLKPKEYQRTDDLQKRIIDKIVIDLEKIGLYLKFSWIKNGRTTTAIKFTCILKNGQTINDLKQTK